MKISKSVLDAISEVMSQPTNQHSPSGNYVAEGVKSTNPGYGYHGTAPEGSNAAAADRRYAAAHKKVSGITGAGEQVVKHYLDSTHGRHLDSKEGDQSYIKKDFADFSKKYKSTDFNESLMDRGPDDTDLEDLEEGSMEEIELGEAIRRGDTDGRSHTDEHGVTWDDEGHNSAGTGHNDRRPNTSKAKHYHSVPYKDKEHAKSEGMKWDKDKSKWYHTDAAKSATSKYRKLQEEEQIDEKTAPMTDDGKKATHTIHVNDDGHKIKAHIVAKDNKHAAEIARAHFPDNAFRVHSIKEEEQIDERFDHREAAVHGIIHPHRIEDMKVGSYHDHYSTKNGDKLQFKVHKHTTDSVVLQTTDPHRVKEHGKYHTYKIASSYKLNEEKKVVGHKFSVTTTDPGADSVSLRDYKRHKMVRVGNYPDREKAAARAKSFYTLQGYKVHDVTHHSEIYEAAASVSTHAADLEPVITTLPDGSKKAIWRPRSTKDIVEVATHQVTVHYSDRNGNMQVLGHRTDHTSKDAAIMAAVSHHLKAGTLIHKVEHKALVEMVESVEEGHATKAGAELAMKKHDTKHPSARHSVLQGRRSGRWHVVRHTSGGMHVIESEEQLDEGWMSQLNLQHLHAIHAQEHENGGGSDKSYKRMDDIETHVKKVYGDAAHRNLLRSTDKHALSAGPPRNMGKKVNEGDESEAEYQEYLKSLKEKKKKKSSIVKTIVKGK